MASSCISGATPSAAPAPSAAAAPTVSANQPSAFADDEIPFWYGKEKYRGFSMIRSSKIVIFEIRFPNCKLRTTKPEALRTSGSLFAALSLVRRRLAERLFHLQCLSDIHQPCRKGLVLLSFHDALRAVLRQCSSSSVFEELFLPESRRPFSFGTFLSLFLRNKKERKVHFKKNFILK